MTFAPPWAGNHAFAPVLNTLPQHDLKTHADTRHSTLVPLFCGSSRMQPRPKDLTRNCLPCLADVPTSSKCARARRSGAEERHQRDICTCLAGHKRIAQPLSLPGAVRDPGGPVHTSFRLSTLARRRKGSSTLLRAALPSACVVGAALVDALSNDTYMCRQSTSINCDFSLQPRHSCAVSTPRSLSSLRICFIVHDS